MEIDRPGTTPEGSVVDAEDAPPEGLFGATGKRYDEPPAPWAMPTPTTVSLVRDGHPSGRHMIDGFRMMAAAARVSGGKHQKDMAEVYDTAALCIENEAKRADRAEELLRAMGSNSAPLADGAERVQLGASDASTGTPP